MAIMVSAGLVVSGAALYVVVIDGFRSLAIQVLGTYTVFRAYVPARWIVRLHGCVYLGIPLLFVLAAAWSRAVDV